MRGVIRGHEPNQTYWIDGIQVSKQEFERHFPDQNLGGCASLVAWKPLHSEALAVHPDLIVEATEDSRKKGIPTEFDQEGRPIFTSREHRREYMKRYGFFDRNGGYSDAQRGQSDANHRDRLPAEDYHDRQMESDLGKEVRLTDSQKRALDRVIEGRIRGK